ncbi:MAG: hypothetical protein R6U98_37275 [Pirellulaceae bacterium]
MSQDCQQFIFFWNGIDCLAESNTVLWLRPRIADDVRNNSRTLVVVRRGWRFFAWVLMDNPFHLFFQTPGANLSVGMRDLNSGFATCGSIDDIDGLALCSRGDSRPFWWKTSRIVGL